jgi:tRNA dimethylallyltransferase
MSSIGYAQWKGYFEGNDNINSAVKNWIKAEQQYSKRQLTWFGRDKRIKWFEINKPEFGKDVEELIRGWVTENR